MSHRQSHRRSCEPFHDLKALRKRSRRGRGVTEFLQQPAWFVGGGCDASASNSGTSEEQPIPFHELARRLEKGEVGPGRVLVTILDDLPDVDLVSFNAPLLLAAGTIFNIFGRPRVIATGTLTEVVYKDRASNVPDQIAGSPDLLEIGVDHAIRFPRIGSVTYGAREFEGSGRLQVSTWAVEAIDGDGFVQPGEAPVVGDVYEVLEYPSVLTGRLEVSMNHGPLNPEEGNLPDETFGLAYLRYRNPDFESFQEMPWPTSIGGLAGGTTFISHSIIERPSISSGDNLSGNNLFTRLWTWKGARITLLLGLFHPAVGAEYPGAIRSENSGVSAQDGDTMFVGSGEFGTEEWTPADWQLFDSSVFMSNASFWNCNHAMFPGLSGQAFFNAFGSVYGEHSGIQLWGKDNFSTIVFLGGASTFTFEQFSPEIILPTLEMSTGPGGPVFNLINPRTTAYAWHPDLGIFSPAPGVETTWANFDVDFPAGFKVLVEDFVGPDFIFSRRYSNAVQPSEHDSVFFDVFFFEQT